MKKGQLLIWSLAAFLAVGIFGCSSSDDDAAPAGPALSGENKSLFIKTSGTLCPPCGSWGWTYTKDAISNLGDAAVPMSIFSANFVSESFITSTADEMDNTWGINGWPTFLMNGVAVPPTGTFQDDLMATANQHASTAVVADIGLDATLDGSTITADFRVKLNGGDPSQHQVAIYLLEDGPMARQAGHSSWPNETAHDNVLRGSFTTGAFGNTMSSADQNDSFTFNIVDQAINTSNLEAVLVVWKSDGQGGYEFVNAASAKVE